MLQTCYRPATILYIHVPVRPVGIRHVAGMSQSCTRPGMSRLLTWHRHVTGNTVEREILVGANFRINGRKTFRRNFRIFIFVCAIVMRPCFATPPNQVTYVYVSTFQHRWSLLSKMASFLVEAMVRGYHIYKDIWAAVVGVSMQAWDFVRQHFRSFYFHILRLHTKYMKICTIRKFPATRYTGHMHDWHRLPHACYRPGIPM